MKKELTLLSIFFLFLVTSSRGQHGAKVDQDLDSAILALIQNATLQQIVPVSGQLQYPSNVMKCTDLIFQDGSELVFTDMKTDMIVIRATNLKVNTPAKNVTIRIASVDPSTLKGNKGATGKNGKKGSYSGADGKVGKPGRTGHPGKHAPRTPDIYIIVDSVLADFSSPTKVNFHINFSGAMGGKGGTGGTGGKGGNGIKGRNAKNGPLGTCKRGPGNGGHGDNGGRGGGGGIGGNGGDGGDVYLIGYFDAIDNKLTYANINNKGGKPGPGGNPGKGGAKGKGAKKGNAASNCSSKGRKSGKSGKPGKPGHRGPHGLLHGKNGKTYKVIEPHGTLPPIN